MSLNTSTPAPRFLRRLALGSIALLVGTALWMPALHLLFAPRGDEFRSPTGISPIARRLAKRHSDLWSNPQAAAVSLADTHVNNPEWDFMGRTFLVLSLANMSLREPARQGEYLALIDRIIDETGEMVRSRGIKYFLMNYANLSEYVQQPVRSLFVDGELALMLGARRAIQEKEAYRRWMNELTRITAERMSVGPVLSCESYPNECWTFCNVVALAAIRIQDSLDRQDHSALFRGWLERVRTRLTDPQTGLLCSSYAYDGTIGDGPEGSTIWLVAHCLELIDAEYAADQYQRARQELSHQCLGFAWAGEWPKSWVGPMDIDSGPTIPIVDVNAGSSGQAFIAAAGFNDDVFYSGLATTLRFAAFPKEEQGGLRFCASNQVGDAVLLYSTVCGPLWKHIRDRVDGRKRP